MPSPSWYKPTVKAWKIVHTFFFLSQPLSRFLSIFKFPKKKTLPIFFIMQISWFLSFHIRATKTNRIWLKRFPESIVREKKMCQLLENMKNTNRFNFIISLWLSTRADIYMFHCHRGHSHLTIFCNKKSWTKKFHTIAIFTCKRWFDTCR